MMTGNGRKPREIALEDRVIVGERLFSPSAARNREPICAAFLRAAPQKGAILEIGGGSGEHAVHIAGAAPHLAWRTGDPDSASRASIAAWIAHAKLANLEGPHAIDASAPQWGVEELAPFDGIVSINMIHIAPFEAAKGLFAGAGRLLRQGGLLFLYGPFSRNGVHTSPSNEAFDASLKSRDPRWGVRDLERDLTPLARNNNLAFDEAVEMPANNLCVIFRKT